MKKHILILFVVFYFESYSQISDGTWVRVMVENVNENFHFNPNNQQSKSFTKYVFNGNKVTIDLRPFDISKSIQFSIKDDILKFLTQSLRITQSSDSLVILEEIFQSDDIANQPLRIHLMKQSYLIQKIFNPNEENVIKNDTVVVRIGLGLSSEPGLNREENYLPIPVFSNEDKSFTVYIQEFLQSRLNLKTEDYAKISFIVDKNGKISNPLVIEGDNSKLNKSLLKCLKYSENKWAAPLVNGKPVRTKMIIPIKIIVQSQNAFKGTRILEQANNMYAENKFKESIEFYTESYQLNPNNPDAIFNRASAYFQLGNVENACKDWKYIYDKGLNHSYVYLVKYCNLK